MDITGEGRLQFTRCIYSKETEIISKRRAGGQPSLHLKRDKARETMLT